MSFLASARNSARPVVASSGQPSVASLDPPSDLEGPIRLASPASSLIVASGQGDEEVVEFVDFWLDSSWLRDQRGVAASFVEFVGKQVVAVGWQPERGRWLISGQTEKLPASL